MNLVQLDFFVWKRSSKLSLCGAIRKAKGPEIEFSENRLFSVMQDSTEWAESCARINLAD